MSKNIFSTPSGDGLKKMLDGAELRQKFITNNIANTDTPGYMAKDFDFETFINSAREDTSVLGLMRTNQKHILPQDDDSPFHLDGEFMRMFVSERAPNEEQEMVNLATNSLVYKASADMLSRRYGLFSLAITGGVK